MHQILDQASSVSAISIDSNSMKMCVATEDYIECY